MGRTVSGLYIVQSLTSLGELRGGTAGGAENKQTDTYIMHFTLYN